jgi:hypothetical protein
MELVQGASLMLTSEPQPATFKVHWQVYGWQFIVAVHCGSPLPPQTVVAQGPEGQKWDLWSPTERSGLWGSGTASSFHPSSSFRSLAEISLKNITW